MNFLKKVGHFLAKVFDVAKKAEPEVVAVLDAALPQYATLINGIGGVAQNALGLVVKAESDYANAADKQGPAKLAAVLAGAGPVIDQWVQSSFPGASKIDEAVKAGFISSLVALVNAVTPPEPPPATPAA